MESFGAKLKREREKKGVTLEDISRDTKIGARMLRALEDDHFEQLPGGIFNKGFVRAYARRVGLDEEQAVADYLEATGETRPPQPGPPVEEPFPLEIREETRRPDFNRTARVPWGMVAVALIVAAVVFAAWGFFSREKLPSKQSATTSPTHQPVSQPAPPPQQQPVNPPAAEQPAAPATFKVSLKATDDCWISVTVDGKQVLQDTLVAPAQKLFQARQQLIIRAGNAGALQLAFNGQPLRSQGEAGEVKTLIFGPTGLEAVSESSAPAQNPAPPQNPAPHP